MSEYHEPVDELSSTARNYHRALTSLKEEIEAVDWYNQRVEACDDPELRRILEHNRDEEIEHAVMTLEWLRRNMPAWGEQLDEHLYKEGPIVVPHGPASAAKPTSPEEQRGPRSLGIGSLRAAKEAAVSG
ncbi:MAG: ferritin [Polyangiaceae bacterium]|nr:ferritin [Myxococcales bacterium]MCB9584840.1 ferritin [Polyangiaceae bacterium]MCB9607587.1 ferritin [Polyangiaceae bacterium]